MLCACGEESGCGRRDCGREGAAACRAEEKTTAVGATAEEIASALTLSSLRTRGGAHAVGGVAEEEEEEGEEEDSHGSD